MFYKIKYPLKMLSYCLRDLDTCRKYLAPSVDEGTFKYQPIRRCWKCHKRFHNLHPCEKCRNISYCSKECQKEDFPRHRINCSPDSIYNQRCGAIIINTLFDDESRSSVATARYIILSRNISPNNIFIADDENFELWDISESVPNLDTSIEDIKFFIERGLDRQRIIGSSFNTRSESCYNVINFLADYGTTKGNSTSLLIPLLKWPTLESLCWIKNTELDINEVFDLKDWYPSDIFLEIVKQGYDVYSRGAKLLKYDNTFFRTFVEEVAKTWRERGNLITKILDDYLIPPLINICTEYLNHT